MFAAIRTCGVTDVEELSELVKEGFLTIVESAPASSSPRETAW